MQVIDNAQVLAAIGGGGREDEISCTISIKDLGCTGSAEKWGEVVFEAFDEMQRWGGNLGRWVYDVTH